MNLQPIRNDDDLQRAFARMDERFRMEQQNLNSKDLEKYIGSSGRVSEVLNRKRRLSLRMIKNLHDGLHIPYECLISAS